MSKEFKLLIETLTHKELINYLLELSKLNDFEKINLLMNIDYYLHPKEILMSSFVFSQTDQGFDYWSKIVVRISFQIKPITALAPDTQIKL
jgi:hypothetical protein